MSIKTSIKTKIATLAVAALVMTGDVAASTAHRLLATLVKRKFAVQGADRLYYPGPELAWRLNSPGGTQLIRLMRPLVEQMPVKIILNAEAGLLGAAVYAAGHDRKAMGGRP